jgi:hypothetical protein
MPNNLEWFCLLVATAVTFGFIGYHLGQYVAYGKVQKMVLRKAKEHGINYAP